MRKLATLLLVGIVLGWASASFAQNHPELAWQVVETEHFRIFYHEGLDRSGGACGAHCRSGVRTPYRAVWVRA